MWIHIGDLIVNIDAYLMHNAFKLWTYGAEVSRNILQESGNANEENLAPLPSYMK